MYRVLGLEVYVVIRLDWVFVWIIVCVFSGVYLRKGESVREKLRLRLLPYLYILKDYYFDFTICPFSLYVIVSIGYI